MFRERNRYFAVLHHFFSFPKLLRDHLKKAVETEKETEEQLNLLLEKLNETGWDLISLLSIFFSLD